MAVRRPTAGEDPWIDDFENFADDIDSADAAALAAAGAASSAAASAQSDADTANSGLSAKKTNSMSTNKLLGRGTASTGVIEEITLGTNLSLTGTTLNATGGGAVTSVNTQTGVVVLTQDSVADGTTAKQYTSTEKTKLSGIATAATANSSDATLLARANHTGTQSADTLTDGTTNKAYTATEKIKLAGLATIATSASASDLTTGTTPTARLGTGTASSSTYLRGDGTWSTPGGSGDVVGPASAVADNLASYSGTTGKLIKDSLKAAPSGVIVGTTDTQTLTNKTLTTPAISSPTGLVKADVGLGSVDNTADSAKPVSSATTTALNLKANLASPTFTGTVAGITATMVGLGNVNNTSDASKPVSTAQAAADALALAKASNLSDLASASTARTNLGLGTAATSASTAFDASGAAAAAQAASQPLAANLTSFAAKTAPTGAVVGTTDTQTLTNKTLTAPVLSSPTGLVKADVGLSNVDNTSNATERAATATLTNKTLTAPAISSPTGIVKGDVGLGNVDNTSNATERAAAVTLTNKRITKRVFSTTDTGTLTPDSDSYDCVKVTALAQAMTIAAPTGTPTGMQGLIIRVTDNGTSRALTWNSAYRVVGVTLPTVTVVSKVIYVGAIWNSDDSKWDVLAVGIQA